MEIRGNVHAQVREWMREIRRRIRVRGEVGTEGLPGAPAFPGASAPTPPPDGGGDGGDPGDGGNGGDPPPDGSDGISWSRPQGPQISTDPVLFSPAGISVFGGAPADIKSQTTELNEEIRMYQFLALRNYAGDVTINSGEFVSDDWVTVAGDWDFPGGDMEPTAGAGGFPDSGQWWNGAPSIGFRDCIVTCRCDTSPAIDASVVARVSGTGNGYEFRRSGTAVWSLNRLDLNVRTTIASGLHFTFNNNTVFGLGCIGDQITAYIDGVPKAVVTDAAHADGRVGLYQASPYSSLFTFFQIVDRPAP